jgi:hypothetical protein
MAIEHRSLVSAPPIHPLAALVTVALDGVFGFIEIMDPLLLLFTCFGVGILGTLSTMLTQRYLAKDEWGPAIAKGMAMGILAGVPYPVAGTVIGAPLLIWAGVHQWVKLPLSGSNQIVDSVFNNAPELEDKHPKPENT